jgi:hypothetical protein
MLGAKVVKSKGTEQADRRSRNASRGRGQRVLLRGLRFRERIQAAGDAHQVAADGQAPNHFWVHTDVSGVGEPERLAAPGKSRKEAQFWAGHACRMHSTFIFVECLLHISVPLLATVAHGAGARRRIKASLAALAASAALTRRSRSRGSGNYRRG